MKCSICHIVLSLCGKRVPLFFVLFYCTFALFLSILIYGNSEFSEETDEPVDLRRSDECGQLGSLQHSVLHVRVAELAVGASGQAVADSLLRVGHDSGELHGVLSRHVPYAVCRQGAHCPLPFVERDVRLLHIQVQQLHGRDHDRQRLQHSLLRGFGLHDVAAGAVHHRVWRYSCGLCPDAESELRFVEEIRSVRRLVDTHCGDTHRG